MKNLFEIIAPFYGLFFENQKKRYSRVLEEFQSILDLNEFQSILDVGCGTGALCSALHEKKLSVTGVDSAQAMLEIAMRKNQNTGIPFMRVDATQRLPFEDDSHDISISSYVAHGLQKDERRRLYEEMGRVSRHRVIIYDYNGNRSLLTDLAEWAEGGDYFGFIKQVEEELREIFPEVQKVNVEKRAALYICKIIQ